MTVSGTKIDLGRALGYAFEDKEWPLKIGLLFVMGLIPGLNIIMWSGYSLTVARRIMFNAKPLPEWSEWVDIGVRGLLSLVGTLVYYIPALLVGCMVLVLSRFVTQSSLVTLSLRCISGVGLLGYVLIASFLLTPGHVRFAQTDQFHVYTDFGARIEDLRTNPALFGQLFVYQALLTLIASVVSGLLLITCIGLPALVTLAFLASGHFIGTIGAILVKRPA
jgi:hypothetical protein